MLEQVISYSVLPVMYTFIFLHNLQSFKGGKNVEA